MSDFDLIVQAYEESGGDASFLRSPQVASLVVNGNQVLGSNSIDGVEMTSEPLEDGVKATIRVQPDTIVGLPVHLCFGMLPEEGVQRIVADFDIGDRAKVEFLAHCTFPNAVKIQHIMEGHVRVGEDATMRYNETHYHGPDGGVEVLPKTAVTVDKGGHYNSVFSLTHGRAGHIDIDYEVDVERDGLAELDARVIAFADDNMIIRETIRLNGERARGLTKSRVAVSDDAECQVIGTTEGNAPYTRGHVDCVEVVRDRAIVSAVPIVKVTDPLAHVTHEAAIGTVDKKELETLMSRGLDEDDAVDVIVRGMVGE